MRSDRAPLDAERSYQANIGKFYAYKVLAQAYLWLPIWIVYLQRDRGLTLTQIGLMEVVFWLVWAGAEIPTGSVADTYGRKTSLAIGAGLHAVGLALFAVAPTFALLMLAYVLWALAGTFYSGADQALLYDTLRALRREDEYTKILGRASSMGVTSTAVASLLGGVLGAWDLTLPFLLTAGLMVLRLVLTLTFREPPQEGARRKTWQYWITIRGALVRAWAQPASRYLFLYAAAVPVVPFLLGYIFLQPYALDAGVPLAALGVVVLGVRLSSVAGSLLSYRIARGVGEGKVMVSVPIAYVLALVGMATLGWAGLPLFLLVGCLGGVIEPLISTAVNREAPSQLRATTLSVVSLLHRGFLAPTQLIASRIADVRGFPTMFLALAGGVSAVLIPILVLQRLRRPHDEIPTEPSALSPHVDQRS